MHHSSVNEILLYYQGESGNRERACVHRAFIRDSFIIHSSMNAFLLYYKGKWGNRERVAFIARSFVVRHEIYDSSDICFARE